MRFLFVLLTLVALIGAGAVHTAPPGQTADSAATCESRAVDNAAYRLRAGDSLEVAFRFTPEFNVSPTIRPDGRIAMSGVGDLAAAGLTIGELTCALESAYRLTLRDPIISVAVRGFENPSFFVNGEVERPGKYELRRDTTITEAITTAGGFKRSAKRSEVYLLRRAGGDTVETRQFDVKAMLEDRQLADDVQLQADDMLFVPQSGFSKIERFIPLPGVGVFVPVP